MSKNRGKEGRDDYLFGEVFMQRKIKEAVFDMSFLLERGYGESSSCELVGNRYKLNKRQQQAIKGMAASETAVVHREKTKISVENLEGTTLIIDGFNQLILLESILSEAYVFKGRDGAYRDLSNLYGTYKSVRQTEKSIEVFAEFFKKYSVLKVVWVFDAPVSNSGRMKTKLTDYANEKGYNWEVIQENNPDKFIINSNFIGVTSDAWILDKTKSWANIIEVLIPENYPFLITC
ncbi:DUF434 domain-containing protein [Tenacibaculum halocynthiae]|uniref:DUF434 domain-containing protein n=1 Tax=Tenacibaculum halocynthiae TaxID=1254437 RepID=UPI003D64C5EB